MVRTIIQPERSIQSYTCASTNAKFINNTISESIIQISGDAVRSERHPNSIYINNEESDTSNQRIVESKICDLFGRLINLTLRSKSPEKNYTPNYPISLTLGLDCQFGEIKFNPITSIQIPRLDLEQYRYDGSTPERTLIKYPSRIEENEEENLLQKMHTGESISQINRELLTTRILFLKPLFISDNYQFA
jgi:hypothetical protein